MDKLPQNEINLRLEAVPDWSQITDTISRTYQFNDFLVSMRYVNQIADHAEAVQHHPDVLIRWDKVTLTINTHDAGGITMKDFNFAAQADAMAADLLKR